MNKVAFLLPKPQMIKLARAIVSEVPEIDAEFFEISNDTAIETAELAALKGANLIIARGYQALLIKKHVAIPTTELVMTGQEIALLITRAKRVVKSPRPQIALVGIRNMFCDIRYFSDIFNVELNTYFVDSVEELEGAAQQAVNDVSDIIIGGDIAVSVARAASVESLFLDCTIDSIRESLRLAKNVLRAQHLEKINSAQMETLLEYSFNGIIKLDKDGIIKSFNSVAQKLIGKKSQDISGKHITQVIENIDSNSINDALLYGKEKLAFFLMVNNIATTVNIACIKVNDEITGVIVSLQENKRIEQMNARARRERYLSRHIVQGDFKRVESRSPIMKSVIEKAKLYLTSKSPVLICGEEGTEKELLSQCIHNGGLLKNGPFVEISGKGIANSLQLEAIFGACHLNSSEDSICFIDKSKNGTIYIKDVECLSDEAQYMLINLIKHRVIVRGNMSYPEPIDVRIICDTSIDLKLLTENKQFREDLFYVLSALTLRVPPIRLRKEDIESYIYKLLDKYSKRYLKIIVLTEEAKKYLLDYNWPGNLTQLEAFIENLVITAPKRRVDEVLVQRLLQELYPIVRQSTFNQKPIILSSPEAAEILSAYEKFHGSRNLMAKELGISTTTLWRKMKKYQIGDDLFTADS